MMEFGKSLRAAREAKGLSIAQLAESTHMAPTLVDDLENENFSRIAAPIYGRGFVKLFCEAVGLEPKPFIDEFMEILNGNREPRIRESPPAPAEETAAPAADQEQPPAGAQPETVPPPAPQPDFFLSSGPTTTAQPPPASAPHLPEPTEDPEFEADDRRTVSRYATPFRQPDGSPSPALWRLGLLAFAALALLVLLICGLRALHQATSPASADAPTTVAADEATDEAQPAGNVRPATAGPRDQQEIPPLYID